MGELNGSVSKFVKNRAGVCKLLADMEGRVPYEETVDFFGGEPEVLFAVLL